MTEKKTAAKKQAPEPAKTDEPTPFDLWQAGKLPQTRLLAT